MLFRGRMRRNGVQRWACEEDRECIVGFVLVEEGWIGLLREVEVGASLGKWSTLGLLVAKARSGGEMMSRVERNGDH